MHISSLPSRYGIGSLGKEAFDFVDFLKAAGQRYWQILPIGPTGYGDSPYQSFSAFAANPYFIDLDTLIHKKLLTQDEVDAVSFGDNPEAVDYGTIYCNRFPLLQLAVSRFNKAGNRYSTFKAANADWLEDYCLFMALKGENSMVAFHQWPKALRLRDEYALRKARARLADEINFWSVIQYLFSVQWQELKDYANKNGIQIIGDIPIYVSPDSSDLWAHPELFQVDSERHLVEVAGCPPDAFSVDGQLWGNPLYDWEQHLATDCEWWVRRLRHASRVYDVVRIDHFRGFESYYAIPAGNKTAAGGCWRKGPSIGFINTIKKKLPGIAIIAEDLGYLTDDVRALLAESGFPGMKVLQFAFDSREVSDYLPHNYQRNSVVYTGTHDNTTTRDWEISAPPEDVALAREYLDITPMNDFTYTFIRAAMGSVSDTCIIPMQDYLNLGVGARMNIPSTLGGNWIWRVCKDALTAELAEHILTLTKLYGRG